MTADLEGSKVLVVDDDEDVRETLVELLEERGVRALGARDGLDALARLEEYEPAVILVDHRMPRMSGAELVRTLRSRGLRVPVVLMTAAREVRRIAAELDLECYLGKPFGIDDLTEQIARALRGER